MRDKKLDRLISVEILKKYKEIEEYRKWKLKQKEKFFNNIKEVKDEQ